MSSEVTAGSLNLDNCAREPIHIPGSIQPHGALIALNEQGLLVHASANVPDLLGWPLSLDQVVPWQQVCCGGLVQALVREVRAAAAQGDTAPMSDQAVMADRVFDVVAHACGDLVICEFEQRSDQADNMATFPQKAHRSMDALKRQRSEVKLLEVAVAAVRELTGFDRVMAYRFRHDDSGDVVAEACHADLDPYLGRRYPASDIPAQARRLYTINSLRLIGNVDYTPVPLLAAPGDAGRAPLDLSHSVLRSVSPIHVEYLRNLGVKASMSVSIVVAGKLWGMLACHHMSPHQVPYSVRMAADVIAQLLASSVQSLAAQTREARLARTAWLSNDIALRIVQREDIRQVLADAAGPLCEGLACDAMVVLLDDKRSVHGDVQDEWLTALSAWLKHQPGSIVHVHHADQLPGPAAAGLHYCGVLALRFDMHQQGWLVGLRREQIQTIRWGGKPEKVVAAGPLGPRLTPRGSFDEWCETVRDTAEPWDGTALDMASQLLDAVSRAHGERLLELDRLRSQLWAVLGHDLRNPLASLSVAAQVLKRGDPTGRMNSVISRSATRMERLLRDVLDISAIQNGLGLSLELRQADLSQLTRHLIEDMLLAHPDMTVEDELPAELMCLMDTSRIGQVLDNLLSNARHHGDGVAAVRASMAGQEAVLEVSNPSGPIPADVLHSLFDPFKRQATSNPRNSTGMGLGLYIAYQIVGSHGGSLAYRHADGVVTFELRLPIKAVVDAMVGAA